MSNGFTLVDLGKLAEPAKVLIEKVSEAVGGCFKPFQIKRVARAEAEAEVIKAKAHIEISELQQRALARFITEEARNQENIERITQMALPLLENTSNPKNMEDDWIVNFFDKCRIVSDEEMQSLWSKVLAGEANAPGTFSKRTVNFLASLDKSDAQLFTSLCGFIWTLDEGILLIYDWEEPIYKEQGINFISLSHLDDIGLISFDNFMFAEKTELPKQLLTEYYGSVLQITFDKDADNSLDIGFAIFTRVGQQLVPICGSKPVEGFQDYVIKKWASKGFILSSPFQ
jgi:hypothetical protein